MDLKTGLEIQRLPEELKERARKGEKVYLGEETRPDWSGYLPFYLFCCDWCKALVKDYSHSWPESQYLRCSECGCKTDFVRFWLGLKVFLKNLIAIFLLRFRKI